MTIVYLNGAYLPLEKAQVSVLDRGFLFGDGVYEVIALMDGKLVLLDDHMARLMRCLQAIHIDPKPIVSTLPAYLDQVIEKNQLQSGQLYVQVTRGCQSERRFVVREPIVPTVLIMPMAARNNDDNPMVYKAITAKETRWGRCDIKAITLLANVLYYYKAQAHNVDEVILLKDGIVTEGASSNVFVVKDQQLITPAKSEAILGGVTRGRVIRVAQQNQIPILEKTISRQALYQADEVWITSSTRDVVPVIEIDQRSIGSGKPGPLWETLSALFLTDKCTNQTEQ